MVTESSVSKTRLDTETLSDKAKAAAVDRPHLVPEAANLLDKLNPVTRLLMAIAASVPILVSLDWVSASVMLGAQLLAFLMCGYSAGKLAKRMAALLILAPIGGVSMALYGRPGGDIYATWGLIVVSENSLSMALSVMLRVLVLGMAAIVLIGGADSTRMADGLAQVLKLPSRLVLGTLAGVRLVGLFTNDWRTMSLARRGRGLGDTGRIRRFVTMGFALLVFAIRRGTKLATAMEARGFGGNTPRTWARRSVFRGVDAVALLITIAVCAAAIWAALAAGTFWFVAWAPQG